MTPGGVFVFGSPRSGTSAMAWAIAQHDAFETGPEIDLLFMIARDGVCHEAFQAAVGREEGWLATNGIEEREFRAAVGVGLHAMLAAHCGGKRWVDSTPAGVMFWNVLMEMFPTARFVHMLRDGRAVVTSLLKSGFEVDSAKDFRIACETWTHYARLGRKLVEQHPDLAVEVRQEDMASDPARELARVFALCGERDDPRAAAFLQTGRVNSSYGNVGQGDVRKVKPHTGSPQKPWLEWSDEERELFRSIAGETMIACGYPLDDD
jgi:hypothetical protein